MIAVLLSHIMSQPALNAPSIEPAQEQRLRHRLRFRLAGLLVLLALAALLFRVDHSNLPGIPMRSLIALLLVGGGLLLVA